MELVACCVDGAALFFFYGYADRRDLHSFPTRRSSDLVVASVSAPDPAPLALPGVTRPADAADMGRVVCGNLLVLALRSEEHTSELQSQFQLVCRLLLDNKNIAAHPQRSA